MNRKRKMLPNGAATAIESARVLDWPVNPILGNEADDPAVRQPSWIKRRLHELGVLAMPATNPQPPGFFVNWTTITSLIVVVSAIVGLWYFTWQAAQEAGYQRGRDEAEKQQLIKQIEEAKRDAAEAKKLQTYSAGVADTHNESKKEAKK
jgi:hypothetical protein